MSSSESTESASLCCVCCPRERSHSDFLSLQNRYASWYSVTSLYLSDRLHRPHQVTGRSLRGRVREERCPLVADRHPAHPRFVVVVLLVARHGNCRSIVRRVLLSSASPDQRQHLVSPPSSHVAQDERDLAPVLNQLRGRIPRYVDRDAVHRVVDQFQRGMILTRGYRR